MKKKYLLALIFVFILALLLLVVGVILLIHWDNSNSNKKNSDQIDVSLVGECGLSDNDKGLNLFKNNPCKIVNSQNNKEIVKFTVDENFLRFTDDAFVDACKSNMCLFENSFVILIDRTNNTQNVLIEGIVGEERSLYYSVYSVDLKNKTIQLKDETKLDTFGFENDFPSVAKRLDTLECLDPSLESYYSQSCIQNWTKLNAKDKALFQKWITTYKTDSIKYYSGEKKYNIDYYNAIVIYRSNDINIREGTDRCDSSFAGDCIFRLKVKDTPECKDLTKIEAYSNNCFENWNNLTQDEQHIIVIMFQKMIEHINKYGYFIPGTAVDIQ